MSEEATKTENVEAVKEEKKVEENKLITKIKEKIQKAKDELKKVGLEKKGKPEYREAHKKLKRLQRRLRQVTGKKLKAIQARKKPATEQKTK